RAEGRSAGRIGKDEVERHRSRSWPPRPGVGASARASANARTVNLPTLSRPLLRYTGDALAALSMLRSFFAVIIALRSSVELALGVRRTRYRMKWRGCGIFSAEVIER